jgi:hypothetical protein
VARFPGHAPSAFLARCSATRFEPSRPGRANGSFPLLLRPAALMGFSSHPSQACSRLRRTRISAHPVPPVRFIAILPPDLFSSGWPALAFVWLKRTVELIATWTSGINLPAIRTPRRPFARANYLPLGRRSCHGLCLLQGCGHTLVHPRGPDPAWIVNLRELATSDFDRRRFACVRSPRRSAVTIDRCSQPVLAVSTALALPIRSWA